MPRLEKWKITDDGCLFGHVFDDNRYNPTTTEFEDNHRVYTSKVVTVASDESFAITQSGTRYDLGEKYAE